MNEFLGAKPGRNGSFDLPVRRGSVIVSLGPLIVSLGPDNPGSIIDAWAFSPLLDLIVIVSLSVRTPRINHTLRGCCDGTLSHLRAKE